MLRLAPYKRLLLTFFVSLFLVPIVSAQDVTESLSIFFRQSKSHYDPAFRDNGSRLDEFSSKINNILDDSTFVVKKVHYIVGSSPEGSNSFNAQLTKDRSQTITEVLKKCIPFADSTLFVTTYDEDWEGLCLAVSADPNLIYKNECLSLIDRIIEADASKEDLIKLRGGIPWKYMLERHFPELRRF